MKFATVACLRRSIGFSPPFFAFYKDAKSVFSHRFPPMETKDFCLFNAARFFPFFIHRLIVFLGGKIQYNMKTIWKYIGFHFHR